MKEFHSFSQIPLGLIKEGVNTAESWGELSQALRIDISWLAQLQALQMLLKDFFPFLRGEGRQKNKKMTELLASAHVKAPSPLVKVVHLPAGLADR